MLIKDLITQLQSLYEQQKHLMEVMGEPEILIDVFTEAKDHKHLFRYAGLSKNIKLEFTADGVYHVISSFEE